MPPPLSLLVLSTPTPTKQFDSDIISTVSSLFPPTSLPSAVVPRNDNANLLDVVTTTVFVNTGPTVTAKPSNSSKVPVGAIVGGLVGGIAITLLTVGGWIWWGKIIERKAKRDRERKRRTSTTSSIKPENGVRRTSGSLNGKNGNGQDSARTSKRSLQQGVHPFMAAATASQKSVTFADDEAASAATATANRENSEVKISISIAEKDRTLNHETEKDVGKTSINPPVRGFSIRGPTPTPPPPARRSHSSERGYIPTRRSPLGQSSPSPSPAPSLSRRRTPSAPQPGTSEALNNNTSGAGGTGTDGKSRSSPPAARSLSVLPIFGSKDEERGREGVPRSPSPTNNSKLFLTRTPVLKGHAHNETNVQNQSQLPVSVSNPDLAPPPTRSSPSAVPPSPAKASVSLSLPGGANIPISLPLSPPTNPGSVNEALAVLSSFESPLTQPRAPFRQGAYASSSITQTNSSGVSGASGSVVSSPSMYSQSGTATDIDPRIAKRR